MFVLLLQHKQRMCLFFAAVCVAVTHFAAQEVGVDAPVLPILLTGIVLVLPVTLD